MEYERTRIGVLDCVLGKIAGTTPRQMAIFCHGFGAPGTDLVDLADALVVTEPKLSETLFVFPAAPIEMEPGFDSRAWWPINFAALEEMARKNQYLELEDSIPPGIETQRENVQQIIRTLGESLGIEPAQTFVGGFSQGAMLATDVFLNSAERLGGLVVWSGTLINRQNWRERVEQHQGLRVVQSHGRLDPILPFQGAIHLKELFTEHGHIVEFVPFQGYHAIPQSAVASAARLLADA
ncbi:MAG: hypothetical protein KF851_18190 [Pirellulaceae bacterium]|nr:hypothetical protein [Pirellulaceae bacterium]